MTKLDITTSSYIRLIAILLGLAFLFIIRDVLVLLFITLIFFAGLSPTIRRWSKYLTRPGAVVVLFLLIFAIISLIFTLLIPPLATQIQQFSLNIPQYTNDLIRYTAHGGLVQQGTQVVVSNLRNFSGSLSNFGSNIFSQTLGVINGLVAVVTVVVLVFYLLLEQNGLRKFYKSILAPEYYERLTETTNKITDKLGSWLRGQVTLMLIVGLLASIGLSLIGLPYALALGLWLALTEVVPIVGPWIGAVPGVIIGLLHAPLLGLLAAIVYVVVLQIESNFLVPRVMGRAVGLNPVVVIIALLIGDKLYGIMGLLLSVPVAAVISVIAEDWPVIRKTFQQRG